MMKSKSASNVNKKKCYGMRIRKFYRCDVCKEQFIGVENFQHHMSRHVGTTLLNYNKTRTLRSSDTNNANKSIISIDNARKKQNSNDSKGEIKQILRNSSSNVPLSSGPDIAEKQKDNISNAKDESRKFNLLHESSPIQVSGSKLSIRKYKFTDTKKVEKRTLRSFLSNKSAKSVTNTTSETNVTDVKDGEIECPECLTVFLGYRNLQIHFQRKHRNRFEQFTKEAGTDSNRKNEKVADVKNVIDVKKELDGNEVTCVCENCQDGGRWQMNGKQMHMCLMPRCNQEFGSASELIEHLLCHTEKKPFVCTNCGGMFLTLENIEKHQLIHLKEGNSDVSDIPSYFQLQFIKKMFHIEKIPEPMC